MQEASPAIFLVQPVVESALRTRRNVSRLFSLMPPLGLVGIAAYLKERGIESRVFDFNADPDALPELLELLAREKPRWLGLGGATSTFNGGLRIARAAKQRLPGLQVVFGGPHVSALREEILQRFPEIDVLVVGEGEETICRLLESGLAKAAEIPGLVFREANGEPRFTGYPELLPDLDRLPFPAYDKLRGFPERYRLPLFSYPRPPGASIVSSRGCPYACSYCDRSVFRRTFRYNSADYLYRHMLFLHERYGIRHFAFYDDQFTFNRERVVALCEKLVADRLPITFSCAVRAEHVDDELMRLMRKAGCWTMSLGIETGDPQLLARHRSNSDIAMLADQIHRIRRADIQVKGLLMLGLPGETEQSIERSRKYVFSLPIDEFSLAKFTPFPGAPLYSEARRLGEFDEDWDRMDCMSFQFVPEGLTREGLQKLFDRFYRMHFRRPRVWAHYLRMVWRSPDSWRRFFRHGREFLCFAWRGSRD